MLYEYTLYVGDEKCGSGLMDVEDDMEAYDLADAIARKEFAELFSYKKKNRPPALDPMAGFGLKPHNTPI